jgi:biopolymer transport protein ExbD
MTPMIDVVFLMLIFFVSTTSFQTLEELLPATLKAPGVTGTEPLPPEIEELEEVTIRANLEGGQVRWQVNQRIYTSRGMLRNALVQLAEIGANVPVILDVAGDVPLDEMINLYDLCRIVGFRDVRFAAHIE